MLTATELTATDLKYVISLANKHRDALGFIPAAGLQRAAANGRIILQCVNGDPVGYLYHGPLRQGRSLLVYQTCIQIDARRLRAATAALDELERRAATVRSAEICLRCAADLQANWFWLASGYIPVLATPGGDRRKRVIIHYRRPRVDRRHFRWTELPDVERYLRDA